MLENPWRGTEGLLFGRMHEDAAIELAAFPARSRVFAIASAGCTAFALAAAGHRVTAVDFNPAQIDYARSRAAGGSMREGAAERVMARARRLLPLIGHTEAKRRAFLELADTEEQVSYWERSFETAPWRASLRVLLSRAVLGLAFPRRLIGVLPERFDRTMRDRLRRGFATHLNRLNPYARAMLLGEMADGPKGPVEFQCAEAASYLEGCEAGSFDAFTLSNIADAFPPEFARRLDAAVRRAASPGAIVVRRSFREGDPAAAARDRSMIWGTVDVRRVEEL